MRRSYCSSSCLGLLGKLTMDKFPVPKHQPNSRLGQMLSKYTWLTAHGWTVCLQLGLYWFVICICTSTTDEYKSLSYFPGGVKSNIGGVVGTLAVADSMGLSIFKSVQILIVVVVGQCVVSYPIMYLVWLCNGLDWLTWPGKACWLFVWLSGFYAVLLAIRVRWAKLERMFFMIAFFGVLMVVLQAYPTVKPPATSPRPVAIPIFWALVAVAVSTAMAICSLILPTTAGSWITGYLANAIRNMGDMLSGMFEALVAERDTAAAGVDDVRSMQYDIYDDLDANGVMEADMTAAKLDFNIYNILLCRRHRQSSMPTALHELHVLCRALVKTSSAMLMGVQSAHIPGLSHSKATDEATQEFIAQNRDGIQRFGSLLASVCFSLSDALVNRQPFVSALEKLAALEDHAHLVLGRGLPKDANLNTKFVTATMHGSLRLLTNQVRQMFQASACLIEQYQEGAMELMVQHTTRGALVNLGSPQAGLGDKGGAAVDLELETVVTVEPQETTKQTVEGAAGPSLLDKLKSVLPKSKASSADEKPQPTRKAKPAGVHQVYDDAYFGPMTGPKFTGIMEQIYDKTGYDWSMIRQFLQMQLGFMVAVAIFLIPSFTHWTLRQSVLYVIYSTVSFPREAGRNLSWALIQCIIVATGAIIGALTVLLLHAINGGMPATTSGKAALMALMVGVMGFLVQAAIQRAHLKYKFTFIFMQTNLLLVALTAFVNLGAPWRYMAFRIFNYTLAWMTVVLAQLVVFPITSREACRNFTGKALEALDDLMGHVIDITVTDPAQLKAKTSTNVTDGVPQNDANSAVNDDVSEETQDSKNHSQPTELPNVNESSRGAAAAYPAVIGQHRKETVQLVAQLSTLTFSTIPACIARAKLNLDKLVLPWTPKFEYTKSRWIIGIMHILEERAKMVVHMMEAVGEDDMVPLPDTLQEAAKNLQVSMSRAFRGLRYFSMALIKPQRMRTAYDDLHADSLAFFKELEVCKQVSGSQKYITSYLVSMVGTAVLLVPQLMQYLAEVFWDPKLQNSEWRAELDKCLPGAVEEEDITLVHSLFVEGYLPHVNAKDDI